ncbi:short chain dehydrogenase [Nocardioides marmoriginsengisoli]|uniref:Short chain dehydrogenase n=1 Tax=Nocardioides marmoriginsengisoli TaxID=661483 RepID=A0A3N0CIS7_9ACTN|nr:short chain dehydrogenase [Nocardioides marmoriginsengisoli]
MKILHVGAGDVGTAATAALRARGHVVVTAHRASASNPVDLTAPGSVTGLLERVGGIDAVICTAGSAPFGAWDELDRSAWMTGLGNKLLGQVELAQAAVPYLAPSGSVTLTSGILSREPVAGSAVASAVNGALEAWVRSVALEGQGRFRINIVSPTLLAESKERYQDYYPGFPTVDGQVVGQAFVRSVETLETGRVYAI